MKANPKNPDPDAKKRILLVDDHPVFRQGMAKVIALESDLEVCGEAANAGEAMSKMEKLNPDLVIVDISLKGPNGLELLKSLRALNPKLPVVIISMHDESLYAERALRAGALGYVMKEESLDSMMNAIRKALAGEVYVSAALNNQLIGKLLHAPANAPSKVSTLSDRQLEVLQLFGRGYNSRRIAMELNLSVKTVEAHRAQIKEKLGIRETSELVRFAVQWVDQMA